MNDPLSFEQQLERHGTLTYTNKGTSMEPLLRQGRDLFTVTKKGPDRCRVGDVVLFRHRGNYVLHRVIKVRAADYVCRGDNAIGTEAVAEEDILGVMSSFVRDGRPGTVNDPAYRAYTALVLTIQCPRVLSKRALLRLKKLLDK